MNGSGTSESMGRSRVTRSGLLLGEWACLGLLLDAPAHGFSIAAQLRPDTEIGRIWSLSRPLTYRSLSQLAERGLVRPVGSEPGSAGPNRTSWRSPLGAARSCGSGCSHRSSTCVTYEPSCC